MPKLTKRVIDAAEIQAAEYFIWDDELPGFGLRVLPSGRKGYIVQYRAGRRSRRMSLGPSTVLTCEQARTRAIGIIAAARNGDDPAAERDAERKTITVKELAERFDKEHVSVRVKETTAKGYRRLIERTILPALGRHRVTEVIDLVEMRLGLDDRGGMLGKTFDKGPGRNTLGDQIAGSRPDLDLVFPVRRLGFDGNQLLVSDQSLGVLDLGGRRRGGQRRFPAGGLGDRRDAKTGVQDTTRLVQECAYEHWHRMLFARFLAETDLLIEPDSGVAITLDEVQELAREKATDWLELASDYAERMLPQIFRKDDPVLQIALPPETRSEMEDLLKGLSKPVFEADDSLGWVYQFWQSDKKDEVNKSEVKIGADELPAVSLLRSATSSAYRKHLMANDLVLISPFSPEAGFNVGNAMARNKYIYCLADAAIVVSCTREKGGTWAGAIEDLKAGWVPLWVKRSIDRSSGNEDLVQQGGQYLPDLPLQLKDLISAAGLRQEASDIPLLTRDAEPPHAREPHESVDSSVRVEQEIVKGGDTNRTGITGIVATDQHAGSAVNARPQLTKSLYDTFLESLAVATRDKPLSADELAQEFELTKQQIAAWLKRAVADNSVTKKGRPIRYQGASRARGQPSLFGED